jgi:hypothetical protein
VAAEAAATGLAATAAAVRYKEPAAAEAATAGTAEAGRYREAGVTAALAAAVQSQGLISSLAAEAAAIAPLFLREHFLRFLFFKNNQTSFYFYCMQNNNILCFNTFAGRVCYSRGRGLHFCAEGTNPTGTTTITVHISNLKTKRK